MSFSVTVVHPNQNVAGTFYVPDNAKVKDALNAAGITSIRPDEEIFLNGKSTKIDEDLIPQDRIEIAKKTAPVVTVIPKQHGGGNKK